jgi:APA family basic amino acid/polyamine antiporter
MSIIPRLNRFDLTMIVISLVIGMGIFANPSEVAVRAGSTWVFFGAWIFGGLVTLCGALTFAEIGARYPTTGGFYKVFSYCYHPAFAFMINWVLVISNAASVAVVAIIGANYINPVLLPADWQGPAGVKIMAIASVLILYALAFMGIKVSARTQNFLTLFKVLAIVVLCCAVFMHDDTHVVAQGIPHSGNLITAFGLSLVAIFFTYGGYQQTINFGGDIIEPKHNIPKSYRHGDRYCDIALPVYQLCLLIKYWGWAACSKLPRWRQPWRVLYLRRHRLKNSLGADVCIGIGLYQRKRDG